MKQKGGCNRILPIPIYQHLYFEAINDYSLFFSMLLKIRPVSDVPVDMDIINISILNL